MVQATVEGDAGPLPTSEGGTWDLTMTGFSVFPKTFFTVRTAVALTVVFDNLTGSRNEFQFSADILFTYKKHLRTANPDRFVLLPEGE